MLEVRGRSVGLAVMEAEYIEAARKISTAQGIKASRILMDSKLLGRYLTVKEVDREQRMGSGKVTAITRSVCRYTLGKSDTLGNRH